MEVSAVAVQQAQSQTAVAQKMVKEQAKADQAVANMVEKAATDSARGQNLDISV